MKKFNKGTCGVYTDKRIISLHANWIWKARATENRLASKNDERGKKTRTYTERKAKAKSQNFIP